MKKYLLLLALGLSSPGCQRISEYYTQKNVYDDCGFGPASNELTNYLNFCGKTFTDPSLTVSTVCLEKAEAVFPKLAPACKAKYETRIRESIESILVKHMEGIVDSPEAGGEPITYETAARLLGRWSRTGRILYYDSFSDLSKTDKGSYQAAYFNIFSRMKTKVVRLTANLGLLAYGKAEAKIADPSFEKLADISKIQTNALFEENAPEIAIEILMPYLQSLAERAEVQLLIYQISCKLSRCVPATENNPRFQLTQLLASYLDRDRLTTALNDARRVQQSIKDPFQILLTHFDKIEGLLANTQDNNGPILVGFKGANWNKKRELLHNFISLPASAHISRFIRISAHFVDLEENFIVSKSFNQQTVPRLAYNPSAESIALISNALSQLNDRLQDEIEEFDGKQKSALQDYKDLVSVDPESLTFDVNRLSLDLADALNDLDVMRQSLSESRERQSAYMKEVSLIASKKSDAFTVKDLQTKIIAATDTIYDGRSPWTRLEEISPRDISYVADDDNELVMLTASSEWHPICALGQSPLASFANQAVLVGPGGYQLSLSNSTALVNARGKERREINYTDQGLKAEVCASTNNPFYNASACGYYQQGKRIEKTTFDSQTQTDSTQTSSLFEAGLRLPNTPLPDYPAGSVIAVLQSADSEIERFFVVDRESVVVMTKGQKLRFIVNDCSSNSSTGSIAIDVSPRVSTIAATTALLTDFATILSSPDILTRKNKIVQGGPSVDLDIQALRSYIMAQFILQHTGGSDYRKLPLVEPIFTAWMDQEMLEVKKRFEIRMQERAVRDIDLQFMASNAKLNVAQRTEKIYAELFELSLMNLDQNILSDRLLRILNFMDSSIMPLVDLYFPGLKIDNLFRDLNAIPLNAPLKDTADKLQKSLAKINGELLTNALFRNIGGSQYQNLVIRIPRPEVEISDVEWPVASNTIRQKVWDYLLTPNPPSKLSLSIPVDALYQRKIKGRLACSQILPVIDSSMIGFKVSTRVGATPNMLNNLNSSPPQITLRIGPKVQYATQTGPIDYRIVNGTLNGSQVSQIPINYAVSHGDLLTALTKLTQDGVAARAAFGYSPFGDFNFEDIDLVPAFTKSKLGDLNGIEEMVLIFRAKVDSAQNPPTWIRECASGT